MKKQVAYVLIFAILIVSIILVSSLNLDINRDGVINMTDLQILASHFQGKGTYNVSYDLNNNSKIDLFDLVSVARQIGVNSSNNSGGGNITLGNESLLAGYTVNSNNVLSGPVPSGWTLVDSQGFDNGSYNTGESTYGDNAVGISTSEAHTGTHSDDNYIQTSFHGYGIKISGSSINSRDLYVSYWRYVTDSNPGYGYMDTNWFMLARTPPGYGVGYGVHSDGGPSGSCCLTTSGGVFLENTNPLPPPTTWGGGSGSFGYTPGKWQQLEWHFKMNDPGQNNGEIEFYIDGKLIDTCDAATGCPSRGGDGPGDFVGATDYSTGDLYIGGDWGKDVWYSDAAHTICSSPSVGDAGMGPVNLPGLGPSNPDPCPLQAPPNGYVPKFHIYIDDLVVLKK